MLFAPNCASQLPHLRPANCGVARLFGTKSPSQNPLAASTSRGHLLRYARARIAHLRRANSASSPIASLASAPRYALAVERALRVHFAPSRASQVPHLRQANCGRFFFREALHLLCDMHSMRVCLVGAFRTRLQRASSSFAPGKLRTRSFVWHKNHLTKLTHLLKNLYLQRRVTPSSCIFLSFLVFLFLIFN